MMKEGIYEESNQRCQHVQYTSHFACQMYDLNLIDVALSLWVKSYDL
jgi:hypothetical protein